jgi:hypothetical protein
VDSGFDLDGGSAVADDPGRVRGGRSGRPVGQPRSLIPYGADVRAGGAALWAELEHARAQFDQRHAHLSGGGSLAFDLLYATGAQLSRVWMFSLAIGLVLAEGNWAINYWRSNVFIAAVAQLLAFYALIGLAGQHLLDRINRRVLLEFGVVMAIVLLLLLWGRV